MYQVENYTSINNIGTAVLLEALLASVMGKKDLTPEVSGKYRVGDIRHCFADITGARRVLEYEPKVDFEPGFEELAAWLEGQVGDDRVAQAKEELVKRGWRSQAKDSMTPAHRGTERFRTSYGTN